MLRLAVLAASAAAAAAGSPWDPKFTAQAQATLAQMTQAEKLLFVHGTGSTRPYVGDVPANTRLNLPPLNLEDGPQGVADGAQFVTCWPSALTVVQSWDPDAMYEYGVAMGQEQYGKGTNVMLGPGVNLARVPWGGRTFEYQGEDPFLASKMVAAEIAGIQSNNISGCIKHFIDNNQEYDRSGVSQNVPQRAQMELYFQAFLAAVDAGVGSAMCSYNRVNNTWACENAATLGYLKNEGGFRGWVMSDWGATHSTVPAALAGLDQQMPDGGFFGQPLAWAIGNGTVPQSRLDDMVMRMLVPMYALGLMTNPPTANRNMGANATSDAHNSLARRLAEKSITLLKNDGGLLPLYLPNISSIAIFGDQTTVHSYGSGGVNTPYVITPYQGIYNVVNGQMPPVPPRAANCTFYNNTDFYQPGNPCVAASDAQDCCAKCSADDSCFAFAFVSASTCSTGPKSKSKGASSAGSGACWKKPDTSGQKTSPGIVGGTCQPLPPSPPGRIPITYNSGVNLTAATALAAASDVAIVVVATTSSEGSDRADLSLPAWQDALVAAVAAVNPRTIVIVRSPGAAFMPWKDSVPSILYELMPGQESGNSIGSTLFGLNNPSGKLPVSFPASMNDTWLGNPVNVQQYPGTDRGKGWLEADYTEELLIGYRWYDAMEGTPLFPFGHGLSYSTFTYSQLAVGGSISASNPNSTASVYATVQNTAGPYGEEVVQLYVGFPTAANEPPKQLKGFSKLRLFPGDAQAAGFVLTPKDLSIWDATQQSFVTLPGTYTVYVGSSSRDIRLTGALTVTA